MIKTNYFCLVFGILMCSVAYGELSTYTTDELLAMVKAQKSRIESIEYSYSYTLSTDHMDDRTKKIISTWGLVGLEHIDVGKEGFKAYLNKKYHTDPKAKFGLGEERFTYDGKVGTRYMPQEAHAEIKPDIYNQVYAHDHFYTVMLMQEPEGKNPENVLSDSSLVGILGSEYATVRPETEEIDGFDCHVVDIKIEGNVARTVYIDTERGYLPVKSLRYRLTDEGETKLFSECRLSDIQNFGGDLWFPLRADIESGIRHSRDLTAKMYTLKYNLRIKKGDDGKPLLRVNHDIPDDKFKGNFAVRTKVYDHVVDSSYLVGTSSARDLDQFVDDRITMAKESNLPVGQFAEQLNEEPTDKPMVVNGNNIEKENDIKVLNTIERSNNSKLVMIIGVAVLVATTVIVIIKKRGATKQ